MKGIVTTTIYRAIIEDVMENISDEFISAGVDDSVLADLKNLWLYKLIQSRVLSHETSGGVGEPDMTSMTARSAAQPAEEDDGADDGDDFLLLTRRPGGSQSTKSSAPTPAANRTKSATSASKPVASRPSNGSTSSGRNVSQLDGACDYVDRNEIQFPASFNSEVLGSVSKPRDRKRSARHIRQLDGQEEEDDEEEIFDDDVEDDDDEDDDGDIIAAAAASKDDDELGSDLDDDDEEEAEAEMESANRMLCQFEKVHRTKNKWKCVFRDGIITIDGDDYCFSKSQCDFEF